MIIILVCTGYCVYYRIDPMGLYPEPSQSSRQQHDNAVCAVLLRFLKTYNTSQKQYLAGNNNVIYNNV